MNTTFIKKNWIYVALLLLIVALNVMPGRGKQEKKPESGIQAESSGLFMEFEDAKRRSEKIERTLKGEPSLYLFYIFLNASIVFIFLLGLTVDGYFVFGSLKGKTLLHKTCDVSPPPWTLGDVFKIVILAVAATYALLMACGFFVSLAEEVTKTKFEFYRNRNFSMIFNTIILDLGLLLVIVLFAKNVYKEKLSSLGLAKKNAAKNIAYGVAGYIGIIPVIVIVGAIIYILLIVLKISPPPQPIVGFFLAEKNITLILISSAVAAVFGPVIEEIFFRGVMYNAVKRKLGAFWGIAITSVLFYFLHVHAPQYFLAGFLPIAILGAALAYLYEKTGSLVPSITLHILNNVGSIFMVFVFKYFNNLTS